MSIPIGLRRCLIFAVVFMSVSALASENILKELGPGVPVRAGSEQTDPKKFSFVILGDRRSGGNEEWPVFDRAIEEINLLNPDFVIMVGDLVPGLTSTDTGIAAEWEDFWKHADAMKPPMIFLPGNHDVSNPKTLKHWKDTLGKTYFSFDYRGCHFLILNTQEKGEKDGGPLGSEQVAFALKDLKKNAKARHTFVFMHKPLWAAGECPDFTRIEQALGTRPYTVVAGHWHHLASEIRHDRRYIVVGSSMGEKVDLANPAPELGHYPFYTFVTVNGNQVDFACTEPGNIWPENQAPLGNSQALRKLLKIETIETHLDGPRADVFTQVTINNGTSAALGLELDVEGLSANGWRLEKCVPSTVETEPYSEQVIPLHFTAPSAALLPEPKIKCSVKCREQNLFVFERPLPLFSRNALRDAPDWMGVGPFDAGTLPADLPDNPCATMPGLFAEHGPEHGYRENARYDSRGQAVSWQLFHVQPLEKPIEDLHVFTPTAAMTFDAQWQNRKSFVDVKPADAGPLTNIIAYGTCAVKSPRNQTVYAQFGIDDYAQIFVNGNAIQNGRVFSTHGDSVPIALRMKKGWNTVMVKTAIRGGSWAFEILFGDPKGELEFAPTKP